MAEAWHALLVWLAVAGLMVLVWAYAKAKHNHGYVDVAWSFCVGVSAAALSLLTPVDGESEITRKILVAAMASIWAGRLLWHLFKRVHNQEEDGRYQTLRGKWGQAADARFFWFYQIQACWALLFALPMWAAAHRQGPLGWLDALGVCVWALAIGGEALADHQLKQFKAADPPKDQVCQVGLWRWSRHPNYFFEWLSWWAWVAIGLAGPWGVITLLGPLLMLVFLFGLTGLPATEHRSASSRPQSYRRYQQTTSALVPWPPANKPHSNSN